MQQIPAKSQTLTQCEDSCKIFIDNAHNIISNYNEFKESNLVNLDKELNQEIKKEIDILEMDIIISITKIKITLEKIIIETTKIYNELQSKMLEHINQKCASEYLSLEIRGSYQTLKENRNLKKWVLQNHNKKIAIDAFVTKVRSLGYQVDDLGIDKSSIKYFPDDDPSWGCDASYYQGGEIYYLRIKMQ